MDSRSGCDFDVSIVIVSFNTRELTLACVNSILAYAGNCRTEVIVVDNQSSDGSSTALREQNSETIVIDSPQNGGFAYGNAIGLQRARGRFVLLLNPDTLLEKGCLETSLTFMKNHPTVGIMGPKVILTDGSQQSSMIRFLGLVQFAFLIFLPASLVRNSAWFSDPRYARLSRSQPQCVDAVSGCFMFVRREVIEEVGGLDTRFFMYGEEIEWCHRAKRAGWRIAYNPEAQITHHGAASTRGMAAWKAVEMARGHILFLHLTRGPIVARIGTGLMIARDLLRMAYHIAHAAIPGQRFSASAKACWARLRFECQAILSLPKGQTIELPKAEDFL